MDVNIITLTISLYTTFVWYLIYTLVRRLLCGLQWAWRIFNGTANTDRTSASAHVKTIILRAKADELFFSREHDFFAVHHSFVHPSYILQDNVTLYALTPKDAIFVETPPGVEMFDSNAGVFTYMVQYRHAVRTVTLPHEAFNRLAQEIGDPKVPVIMFPNTGRCGSTLVSQMFEACNVQSDSEPDVTLSLTGLKMSMPREQFLKLVQSTVRLLCKPRNKVVSKILIKLRSMGIMHCMDMAKLFPEMTFLFMYRDPLETMRSWSSSVVTRPAFSVFHFMVTTPSLRPMMARLADFMEYNLWGDAEETAWMRDSRKSYEPYEYWNLHQCWIILKYLELYNNGVKINAIRYGDIIKDPEGAVKKLFQYCNMQTNLVDKALDAMGKDSQRGTSFSQDTRNTSRTQHGEDELRVFNDYCRATGIPLYSHDGILPGTIQ